MMDFDRSEEQQALRDLARDFAQKGMAPLAAGLDRQSVNTRPAFLDGHVLTTMT